MILHSILQLHTGKGAIVFVYPIGTYMIANLIILLIEANAPGSLSGMESMLIPGITFILAAIWTYFTKDSYYKDPDGNRKKVNIVNSFLFITMKKWVYIFGITGLVFMVLACMQPSRKSKVVDFAYGGYGDTSLALLSGQIFRLNVLGTAEDSLIALTNIAVRIEENNKTVLTDSSGRFEIWSEKGIFNLLVTGGGYQSLRIKNYVSDPDRFSNIIIHLEKGKETQAFEIPGKPRE